MPVSTPSQHIEQLLLNALEALTRGEVAPWSAMFADDGVQEFPYAPTGYPARVVGKPAIAAYLAGYPDILRLDRINAPTFHHCGPVMVAEFSAEGKAVQTGRPYRQRYISVVEHRAGLITRYVDYWNPLVAMEALGGAEALQAFGAA